MIRVITILTAISLGLYALVSVGYGRLEGWLQKNTITPPPPQTTMNRQASAPAGSTAGVQQDYGIIIKRNIFSAVLDDTKPVEKKEEKIDTESLGRTTLPLTLLGTITGDKHEARAIIQNSRTKAQDMYRIGDAVENGIIKAIERGKIVLRVRGRNEELLIEEEKSDAVPTMTPSTIRPMQPETKTRKVRIQPRRQLPTRKKSKQSSTVPKPDTSQ